MSKAANLGERRLKRDAPLIAEKIAANLLSRAPTDTPGYDRALAKQIIARQFLEILQHEPTDEERCANEAREKCIRDKFLSLGVAFTDSEMDYLVVAYWTAMRVTEKSGEPLIEPELIGAALYCLEHRREEIR